METHYHVYDLIQKSMRQIGRWFGGLSAPLKADQFMVIANNVLDMQYNQRPEYADHLQARFGLVDGLPNIAVESPMLPNYKGHGFHLYECCGNKKLRYLVIRMPNPNKWSEVEVFYVLPKSDVEAFVEHVRKQNMATCCQYAPLLRDGLLEDIVENSIGFLLKAKQFNEYGVRLVRGILLDGSPGNGKTMICRWLKTLCYRESITCGTVTGGQIEYAYNNGHSLSRLFTDYTVTFFDDVDVSLLSRSHGKGAKACDLLSAMDGVNDDHHRLRVFTTNENLKDLDNAIFRPGRIDKHYTIQLPSSELRRKLVELVWPKDIAKYINEPRRMDFFLKQTEGYSFAELEQIRTELVTQKLMHNCRFSLDDAIKEVDRYRTSSSGAKRVGFAA